jgi:hypothetical protein
MWGETLNPSGLSLPFGCADSHGVSSGRILCEQFSVHPNHPKMGMYFSWDEPAHALAE